MKLIILSDIHLMAPGETAHDLNNHQRLQTAIDRINTAYADADLVVFAGDLSDRGATSTYQDLLDALPQVGPPIALTVGNHDNRENFCEVFGRTHCDVNGFVQSAHDIDGHLVLVLDSLEKNPDPEATYYSARTGHFCDAQLAWIEEQLEAAHDKPVVVILHHNVLPVAIQMDPHGLRDTQPFVDLLVRHGDVRQVISGHIHMTTTTMHRGIAFTTIAGGYSTSVEDFGTMQNKYRRSGPAQMAVVLSDASATTLHFDNYVDDNLTVPKR